MAIYCIWSGGDGTQTNTTQTAGTLDWSKADASVADLITYDAAAFTTSGNTIYFADDHNDPNKAAHWTLTGPTSGLPVILISADRTQSTPTVKAGTGDQLSSLGGTYDLMVKGSFSLHSMRCCSGGHTRLINSGSEQLITTHSCTYAPGRWSYIFLIGPSQHYDMTVDLTADGTDSIASPVILTTSSADSGWAGGHCSVSGLAFINAVSRTSVVMQPTVGLLLVDGADFSGFTHATTCEIVSTAGPNGAGSRVSNCKTAATWAPFAGTTVSSYNAEPLTLTNVGPADAPTYLAAISSTGRLLSSTDIYRTGGATIEGVPCSWLITTTSNCSEHSPFYTPWRYGTLSSTGSKTFDVYVTNDTADLTDAEIWLEVEYKNESTEAIWARATDQRATITTTAAAQTDDTTSTWNGSGPSFTYKQKLSVTATVNQTGQYRVRVAVGKTSVAGSAYLYIDPAVTVS